MGQILDGSPKPKIGYSSWDHVLGSNPYRCRRNSSLSIELALGGSFYGLHKQNTQPKSVFIK